MTRFSEVKLQLKAVEFLRLMKERRTYSELHSETGVSITDLSRYVNGKVLPSTDRAKEIVGTIGWDVVVNEVRRRIVRDEDDYIDHSQVVFSTEILKRIPPVVATYFDDSPDAVLTAASDGIPVATHIASFYDVDCAYAKKDKETGVRNFVESSVVMDSGRTVTYYLPEGIISSGQDVLVVDDMMRTGHTQTILSRITEKAGADLFGVFVLFSLDEVSERLEKSWGCPVKTLITLD